MMSLPNKLLISVHDVMPETLPEICEIVEALERRGRRPVTLLVAPGRRWRARQVDELRRFQDRGHELAGHGWRNGVPGSAGIPRRPARLAVTADTAEHRRHDGKGIARLIRRCREWFADQGLGAPRLYVPPAWVMGRIRRLDIRRLGFRYFEYAGGYYDAAIGVYQRVPIVGFEADGALRAAWLRLCNRINCASSHRNGWLRVAIRPTDPNRSLSTDLACLIRQCDGEPVLVSEIFENGPPELARADRPRGQVQAGETPW